MALGLKEILGFIKIEHTLFSLPFVFIGALLAGGATWQQLAWILVAAIGARGLAMSLNRIIDKEIDASNPRTASRHLPSGIMTMATAWSLSAIFLSMLLIGAWMLNEVALMMAWLPVACFFIYPYMKRKTWACHIWLGLCLGLAPAGAWLCIVGGELGWTSITEGHWWPEIFLVSIAVGIWIAAFDIGYALMDIDSDRANNIHSFPAAFGPETTIRTGLVLTVGWGVLLLFVNQEIWWLVATGASVTLNLLVLSKGCRNMGAFQNNLFRASVSTGWLLLGGLALDLFLS